MSAALNKAALLAEFGSDDRATLLDFLEAREVEEGRALFRRGDESQEMYLLVEGTLRLEVDGRDAGVIAPGDAVGTMSLVRMGGRQCAALAQERCRVLVLSRASYLRLRSEAPGVALLLQEAISQHVAAELLQLLERA